MNAFFSTFISGLKDVVNDQLEVVLRDFRTHLLLDGLVSYETSAPLTAIKELAFLNNSFFLIQEFTNFGREPIREMMESTLRTLLASNFSVAGRFRPRGKTFRVISSLENELVPVESNLLEKMENAISRAYLIRPNRAKPDIEFWFLCRSEGYGLFGIRLTRHKDYSKLLSKGELRPELASLLTLISEPSPHDVFLDPFCGSGAIPVARAKTTSKQIIAGDSDKKAVELLRKKIGDKIQVRILDALTLQDIESESVDKIVTDPPWGYYEKLNDLQAFYRGMIFSFLRVLKESGTIVILTGRKDQFESVMAELTDTASIIKRYDVLVSGKKAGIYKLKRIAHRIASNKNVDEMR